MDLVVGTSSEAVPAAPDDLIAKALEYARASKSKATLRTYSSAWRVFTGWCRSYGLDPLPSSSKTVAAYVAAQAERIRPVTIKKHLAAISTAHKSAGLPTPTDAEAVRLTMQGLRRVKGVAASPKAALRTEHIRLMVAELGDHPLDARDRALLLMGFATGMRRSEIVGLDLEDIVFEPEGAVVTIRRSKRDQEGRGRPVLVLRGDHEETCPVRALRRWTAARARSDGPMFVRLDRAGDGQRLSSRSVALVVKRRAEQAGLDPVLFSGHSLRRGFVSETARGGASEADIARTTGHRSIKVLRGYVEQATMFENAAGRVLDL